MLYVNPFDFKNFISNYQIIATQFLPKIFIASSQYIPDTTKTNNSESIDTNSSLDITVDNFEVSVVSGADLGLPSFGPEVSKILNHGTQPRIVGGGFPSQDKLSRRKEFAWTTKLKYLTIILIIFVGLIILMREIMVHLLNLVFFSFLELDTLPVKTIITCDTHNL